MERRFTNLGDGECVGKYNTNKFSWIKESAILHNTSSQCLLQTQGCCFLNEPGFCKRDDNFEFCVLTDQEFKFVARFPAVLFDELNKKANHIANSSLFNTPDEQCHLAEYAITICEYSFHWFADKTEPRFELQVTKAQIGKKLHAFLDAKKISWITQDNDILCSVRSRWKRESEMAAQKSETGSEASSSVSEFTPVRALGRLVFDRCSKPLKTTNRISNADAVETFRQKFYQDTKPNGGLKMFSQWNDVDFDCDSYHTIMEVSLDECAPETHAPQSPGPAIASPVQDEERTQLAPADIMTQPLPIAPDMSDYSRFACSEPLSILIKDPEPTAVEAPCVGLLKPLTRSARLAVRATKSFDLDIENSSQLPDPLTVGCIATQPLPKTTPMGDGDRMACSEPLGIVVTGEAMSEYDELDALDRYILLTRAGLNKSVNLTVTVVNGKQYTVAPFGLVM